MDYNCNIFQDIFVHLCTVDDSLYFMCNTEAFKFLAEMIQHVPLPLRARYVFCCAPINNKLPFVCATFLKVGCVEVDIFDWFDVYGNCSAPI